MKNPYIYILKKREREREVEYFWNQPYTYSHLYITASKLNHDKIEYRFYTNSKLNSIMPVEIIKFPKSFQNLCQNLIYSNYRFIVRNFIFK